MRKEVDRSNHGVAHMTQHLDYASPPPPSSTSKVPLFVAVAGVLFAAGSVLPSSLISRRVFDQSPNTGRYDQTMLLELVLSLGGIVCGLVALSVGLYRRQVLAPLLGLLVILVSLASAGYVGSTRCLGVTYGHERSRQRRLTPTVDRR